jgi:hypothetical protein
MFQFDLQIYICGFERRVLHRRVDLPISLPKTSRALLERMQDVIMRATEIEIRHAIASDSPAALRDDALGLTRDGDYSALFAPFDWVNDKADIIIIGVTPGKQQSLEALLSFRAAIAAGAPLSEAAARAKSAASFKGGMRTLAARLMDHFALHRLFGLASTLDLFGAAAHRAHYTSVLRYPVLKRFGNYSGDSRITVRPFMRRMVEAHHGAPLHATHGRGNPCRRTRHASQCLACSLRPKCDAWA